MTELAHGDSRGLAGSAVSYQHLLHAYRVSGPWRSKEVSCRAVTLRLREILPVSQVTAILAFALGQR